MISLLGGSNFLGMYVGLAGFVIAIVMIVAIVQAGRGKIVAINTIKGIGLAGIIISVLILIVTNPIVGAVLLVASILYRRSTKNIRFAKVGAIVAGISILFMVVSPFIYRWLA